MATLVATLNPNKLEPWMYPASARTLALQFAPNLTLAKGTVIGQITASGLATSYASANSDGSQVPIGFLEWDIVTDANGLIVYGLAGASIGISRGNEKTAPVFYRGTFLISQLVGYDANVATVAKARVVGVGAQAAIILE